MRVKLKFLRFGAKLLTKYIGFQKMLKNRLSRRALHLLSLRSFTLALLLLSLMTPIVLFLFPIILMLGIKFLR